MNRLLIYHLVALLFISQTVFSQTDSLKRTPVSGDSLNIQNDNQPGHRQWKGLKIIVPAALITYGAVSIRSGTLRTWNENIQNGIWVQNPHSKTHIDNYLQWSPAVIVYGLNLAGIKGKNNFRDRSIIYGISTVILTATVQVTKNITKEMRPDGSDKKSFPSGHTATAFAAAEFMRREYKDVSPWYGVAGYALAATTGYLRLYNNKHWFGDVIGGAGVGILSTDIAYWVYPSIKRWLFKDDKKSSTMVLPYYQQGSVGLGLVRNF